ncbi:MAG: hypothetical protein AAF629_37220 [Chloroflexota bacterium]
MPTEGTIVLFNATPKRVDIILNDAFLKTMEPVIPEFNYAPHPPATVERVASSQPIGRAVFGDTNTLEVATPRHSQTRYNITNLEQIPIEDDLTLTIFEETIVLAHNGDVLDDTVERQIDS